MKNIIPRYEWLKYNQINQYSIIVSCHDQGYDSSYGEGRWMWCIYLQYQEGSKIDIQLKDSFEDVPLHGGVSYERRIHTFPVIKKYDWQKDSKSIKVGADYNHLHDEYFKSCSPLNGIPPEIINDYEELNQYVLNLIGEEK